MNNKGFTLIELTAIVAVLAIIFLFSFPTLLNMTRNDSKKEKEDLSDTICEAGKTYIYNNIEDYNDQIVSGNEITISIQTLIDNELVKEGTKDPDTKEEIDNKTVKYTVLEDKSLDCSGI